MTALQMEDFFLADDIEALGYGPLAESIRGSQDHEEVNDYRRGIARLVEVMDTPGLIPYDAIATWEGGLWTKPYVEDDSWDDA
jgi:hypothetical protein